jgi:hypothetical protein
MNVVHFLENNAVVLSQLRNQIPAVDENVKIKGRKGIVLSVKQMEENKFHVHVVFEKIIKNKLLAKDPKKKKR